ncbi:MAG: TIM-barrel domain-containing protein [Acidimicrobiales bacterium]
MRHLLRFVIPLVALAGIVLVSGAAPSGAQPAGAASRDTSPVDLATPIDMEAGMAHSSAVVRVGDVRVEVLSPSLLRLEYSPSRHFENSPTVNALDRRMPVPSYSSSTSGGWLTVRTASATVRYKLGSGPFTPLNTSLKLSAGGRTSTVAPSWDWECTFGQVCQAGAATLGGGATLSQTFAGYQSTAGYAGFFIQPGASVTWHVLGSNAGPAVVSLRYYNLTSPPLAPNTSTLDLDVNGRLRHIIDAAPTTAAEPWTTFTTSVPLVSGTNSIKVVSTTPNSFDLAIDTLAVGAGGSPPPVPAPAAALGGWLRGFDTDTYNDSPTCGPGQSGDTCEAGIQPLNTDGLLDTAGWRLLDDTQSALWTRSGWTEPRPANGDLEDGYLFAYGRDYAGALHTLARLTGPAPLLPRDVFGVWYSDYTPYSSNTIENSVYPEFVANHVPLDTLSLDTDWKAPNDWNAWEWNPSLFPSPSSFLSWARSHGIDVTLNIHSSIDDDDPKLPEAERIAGNSLASSVCTNGNTNETNQNCKVWDWSSIPQAESNFAIQQGFQHQGVSFWWLDWCCDDSVVSTPG